MKNFCLLMNPEKEKADEIAAFITAYLNAHGASCTVKMTICERKNWPGKRTA
jgi:hypothetical protein